ncbi:uncharacterized protein LOC103711619 [Phoenix dactylifera]|uniref:Uncharacterized protein LOC103711619 n=1 Tax=Phoenix dactylifera TaxID=42345 RepID=A0A8B8ZU54_PHODC|nr:uncharacterized protein LOC103711619 [Phoenix dactylifera]
MNEFDNSFCLLFLLFTFYFLVSLLEWTGIVKPRNYGLLPRIMNWDRPQLMKRAHVGQLMKGFKEGDIIKPPRATEDEELLFKVGLSSYPTKKDEGTSKRSRTARKISMAEMARSSTMFLHAYRHVAMEATWRRAMEENAEIMELWKIVTEQQKLITELIKVLKGEKAAEKLSFKTEVDMPLYEFESGGSPRVADEQAEIQPSKRRVTERVLKVSLVLQSPFIPLP